MDSIHSINLNPISIQALSLAIGSSVLLTACSSGRIHHPISNIGNRATPLSFGLHVTPDPAENPIDPPERFSGFHSALDYEVSEGELEGDVPVYAICSGNVIYSGFVEGYGGLLVHRCKLNGAHVTVLYGHLNLEGIPQEGDDIRSGQTIGLLADARSYASGYNRKHLHLGIHKGKKLDFRGYVQKKEELNSFIDPNTILSSLSVDLPGQSPGETPYWEKDANEDTTTDSP